MRYDNSGVRRRDRLMDESRALELLKTAEFGVLSMADGEQPYGLPLNYVWDGADSIYIHCAPVGRKLEILKRNPQVSFCIVGGVHLMPGQFTTEYQSVILEGTARMGLPPEERQHALELLVGKLSADFRAVGNSYIAKSFHRTEIIRVDFTTFSGKRKDVVKSVGD